MKLFTAVFAAALLVPGVAFAQSTSQNSGDTGAANQGQDQNYSQQNQQPNNNAMNSQGTNSAQQQSLEGCVTRRATEWFITPANGTPVRLRSNQDLSTAENHNARITGQYENGSSAMNNTQGQNTATSNSGMASNSNNAQQNSSPNSSGETTSQSGQNSGTMNRSSQNGQNNGQDFIVTRVDSVSSTCPANTQGGTNRPY